MATFNPASFYQPQAPIARQPQPQPQPQPVNLEAVGIHIYNPTVNAGNAPVQPPINSPYAMPQAPIYNVPQSNVYDVPQAPVNAAPYPPPFIPQAPAAMNQAQFNPAPVAQQPIAPPPPAVIDQPAPLPTAEAPAPAAEMPAPPPAAPVTEVPTPAAPATAAQPAPAPEAPVDAAVINKALTSANPDEQGAALFKIADTCDKAPAQTAAFLGDETIQAMTNIMVQDTAQLQGPEKDKADTNKMNSMFAMAIIHKNLKQIASAQGVQIPFTQMPAITQMLSNTKNDPNPAVRLAGISALTYAAQPEDKEDLTKVFTAATSDTDPNVKAAAQEALQLVSGQPQSAQPAPQTKAA